MNFPSIAPTAPAGGPYPTPSAPAPTPTAPAPMPTAPGSTVRAHATPAAGVRVFRIRAAKSHFAAARVAAATRIAATFAFATGLALTALLPGTASAQTSEWIVELEGGPIWQSYNDVEIPNDGSATRFSLYGLAGSGRWPGARLYVTWNVAERHGLRLLLAPFSLTETGIPARDVRFAGETFQGGLPTEATYTFNSYRVSYRYRWHEGERTTAWVGGTAKLRDATIALDQDGVSARKDDLGFVPLLHLAGEWRFAPGWWLGVDMDGLAGGPGRAFDVAVEVGYDLSDRWSIQGGYRTVEGGADVEEVYTFAWLHSAVVSVLWRW